jgi:hypothetical protein
MPTTMTPEIAEPCARGIILHSFRVSAVEIWGEDGLRAIAARLPEDTRARTLDEIVLPVAWLPERDVMRWHEVVFTGPARSDEVAFRRFMDRTMDHGFGRVRRLLLRFVTPHGLMQKAAALWRHDHTHGSLEIESRERSLTGVLRDHPYSTTPISRLAIAEVFRYALEMSGVKNAREEHAPGGAGDLLVRLAWD